MNYKLTLKGGKVFIGDSDILTLDGLTEDILDAQTEGRAFKGKGAVIIRDEIRCVTTDIHPDFVILNPKNILSLEEVRKGEVPQVREEAEEGFCAKFQE